MRTSRTRAELAALAILAAAWGCGSGDPPPEAGPGAAPEPVLPAAAPGTGNRAPEIRRVLLEPDSPRAGDTVTARVDAADPDGDALHLIHRWRVGDRRIEGESDTLVVPAGSRDAMLEVEVTAHDGELESEPRRASTRVLNHPPRLTDLRIDPEGEITVEDTLAASARAEDGDGDPVEYSYTWYVNGDPIDATGDTLSGASLKRGDRIEVEVVASDGEDRSEPQRSPPVGVINSPPRITSSPGQLDASGTFTYQVRVQDPDRDRRLRFRLVRAPAGMKIDWLKGAVTWQPTPEQAGRHPVQIEVADMAGGLTSQSFDLEVGLASTAEDSAAPAAPAP